MVSTINTIMGTKKVLVVVLAICAFAYSAPTDAEVTETKLEQEISDSGTELETTDEKRGASTTFCVEIRPSDPYQKPFQVRIKHLFIHLVLTPLIVYQSTY